jgi:putative Mg2+ transporter-C (MgtC) family protein
MEILIDEFTNGLPDRETALRFLIRLIAALVFGSAIGLQRAAAGKPAGMRTHVLVATGTCVFILASTSAGFAADPLSRVIQGIATGIGFLGAGTILKNREEREIHGLTSAAGVWMTAAIGVATGLGNLGLALAATLIGLIILILAEKLEFAMHLKKKV